MDRAGRLARRLVVIPNPWKPKTDQSVNPIKKTGLIAYFKHFPNAVSFNHSFLRHFAKYCAFPVKVGKKVSSDNRTWKNWLFNVVFLVCVLRCIFVVLTLLLALTVERFYNPALLPFHAVMAAAFPTGMFGAYYMLISNRSEFVPVWNFICENINVVQKFTVRRLFLFVIPVSLYSLALLVSGVLAWNPHWLPQFRYLVHLAKAEGYLDKGLLHNALVVFATFLDFSSEFTSIAGGIVLICSQQLFLEVWSSACNELMTKNLGYIQMFLDFMATLYGQLMEVTGRDYGNSMWPYTFTTLATLHVFIRIILLYAGTVGPLAYPTIYYEAPKIAIALEQVKPLLLRNRRGKDFELFKRQIRSVATRGVWVGRIGTFEQESMLIFFNFVVNQVASVVLTYRSA